MRRLLAVLMLFMLFGCGGIVPPPPPPPPPPPVDPLPPMDMLLRRDGTNFVDRTGKLVNIFGAIPCCRPLDLNGVQKTGWPIPVSPAWRNFVEGQTENKVNFYHARLGPFFAGPNIEGQWTVAPYLSNANRLADLTKFDSRFWDIVYEWFRDAGLEGSYVEVDINDGWWAQQLTIPNPMRAEWNIQRYAWNTQVGVSVIVPGQHIDNWLRQIVCRPDKPEMAIGRLSNVIWQDGNEVGVGPYNVQWTQSMKERIRHWEGTCGGGVYHLFGTNSGRVEAEQRSDFLERHQTAPLFNPILGKPSSVNEYNPKPELTAEQLHRNYCTARRAGTHYWYWRHSQDHAAMVKTLKLMAGGCADTQQCPDPRPNANSMKFVLVKHNGIWDSTYTTVGQAGFCTEIGMCCMPGTGPCGEPGCIPRAGCPIRPEGHPERHACEREFIGSQKWWCNGQPIPSAANPAQAVCTGTVRTCTEDGKACASAVW